MKNKKGRVLSKDYSSCNWSLIESFFKPILLSKEPKGNSVLMSSFIIHQFYVGYSSFQCGTEVLHFSFNFLGNFNYGLVGVKVDWKL